MSSALPPLLASWLPLAGGLLAAVGVGVALARRHDRAQWRRVFEASARRAGWTPEVVDGGARLEATVRGLRCSAEARSEGSALLRLAVDAPIEPGFVGARPTPPSGRPAGPDPELHRFDVDATPEVILGRLHGDARRGLLDLLAGGWTIANEGADALVATHPAGVGDLRGAVESLAAVADGLRGEREKNAGAVPERLLQRLETEPRVEIRLAALERLLADHSASPTAEAALAVARAATEPALRHRALREVQARGAQLTDDEGSALMRSPATEDRVAALQSLEAADPFPEADVVACLRASTDAVAVAAAEALVSRGTRAALPALQQAARQVGGDPEARARLRALAAQARKAFGIGADEGGLSVMPEADGGLSLEGKAHAGALSTSPER
jgi:hypothetical protein